MNASDTPPPEPKLDESALRSKLLTVPSIIVEKALILYVILTDRFTPLWVKALVVAALVYLINPLDAIPDVLPGIGFADDLAVLALTLEKAERYYLDLFRADTAIHEITHRALVLCNKTNVEQAYALCREGHFHDYILFWPLSFDTRRLMMSVNRAMQELEMQSGMPTIRKMAAQARRLTDMESVLQDNLTRGGECMASTTKSLQSSWADLDSAFDDFSRRIIADGIAGAVEVRDVSRLQREIERYKTEDIQRTLLTADEALIPMNEWIVELNQQMTPHLECARSLQLLAKQIRPTILIVDDDAFQCKVLAQILGLKTYDLVFAASGLKALTALQKRSADLILMDVDMPDMDGVEVTRRLKSIEQFADIPVIMITGKSQKDVVINCLKAGAIDFIVKPFDKDVLLAKISKLVQKTSTA